MNAALHAVPASRGDPDPETVKKKDENGTTATLGKLYDARSPRIPEIEFGQDL